MSPARGRPSLDRNAPRPVAAGERQAGDATDGLDARQRGDAIEHARVEPDACVVREIRPGLGQVGLRQPEPRGQHGRRIEAEVDALQTPEALQQQRGADEQHQRERELADDQGAAQVARDGRRRRRARPSFADHLVQIRRCDTCSAGASPKRMPVSSDERRGEREDRPVDADARAAAAGSMGLSGTQAVDAPDRDETGRARRRPRRAARSRSAAGAPAAPRPAPSARADGDLALPRGGAREQQVGDVGAGDQQHEADGGQQRQERRPRRRRPDRRGAGSRAAPSQRLRDSRRVTRCRSRSAERIDPLPARRRR